jgi:hypothetical protein
MQTIAIAIFLLLYQQAFYNEKNFKVLSLCIPTTIIFSAFKKTKKKLSRKIPSAIIKLKLKITSCGSSANNQVIQADDDEEEVKLFLYNSLNFIYCLVATATD